MADQETKIKEQITILYVHLAGAYAKQEDIRNQIAQLRGMEAGIQRDIDSYRSQIHAKEEVQESMQVDEESKKKPQPQDSKAPGSEPGGKETKNEPVNAE